MAPAVSEDARKDRDAAPQAMPAASLHHGRATAKAAMGNGAIRVLDGIAPAIDIVFRDRSPIDTPA